MGKIYEITTLWCSDLKQNFYILCNVYMWCGKTNFLYFPVKSSSNKLHSFFITFVIILLHYELWSLHSIVINLWHALIICLYISIYLFTQQYFLFRYLFEFQFCFSAIPMGRWQPFSFPPWNGQPLAWWLWTRRRGTHPCRNYACELVQKRPFGREEIRKIQSFNLKQQL